MSSHASKNLRYLRKLRGWTQDQFANKLNIKRSLLGAYEEERAEPRIEVLQEVARIFKLSMDEILLNDLAVPRGGGSYIDQRRALKMASEPNQIQFVPVKAAAGYLAGYADPEFIEELNSFTLPMLGPGNYRAFEIAGDSMLPTPSGSVIVGERIDGLEDIRSQDSYIVVSKNGGIVYKRVQRNNKNKAVLTLVSDNSLYEPYQVNLSEIVEFWNAKMILTKANQQRRWDVDQLAGMVTSLQQQVSDLSKKNKN
ncbi:LexA family transcriptional regulator [Rhizosphaericola mali]|uniref:LexA family transcriptional regulator n=1 Tax=Rhizosphaericola mali TaxID=2545455 RepID=A0A5P2FVH5_9BACT|nr:LexA family transcriptional regulator [Rhizosphaericola mali]QES87496.1 LexA family transcriptional regulator [Rhizosphaericola mali]